MKYLGAITDDKDLVTKEYVDNHGGGGGGGTATAFTVNLTAAGWSNNTQTVTAQGVTVSNLVIISPAAAYMDDYTDAGIKCTAQATNSLTFSCEFLPTAAITVNVGVIPGEWATYFTGSSAPAASLGADGDIYLKE